MKWFFLMISGAGFALLFAFVGAAAFNTAWPETILSGWLQTTINFMWGVTGMSIALKIWIGEIE